MITQKITAKEARDNFTDLLGTVYYGKESVVVEKQGRPFAIVINPDEYGNYIKYKAAARKRILEIIEEIQVANGSKNYGQTLKDNTVTVRDRDTTEQVRVKISELRVILRKVINEGQNILSFGKKVNTRVK